MNTRTTLILLAAVIACGAMLLIYKPDPTAIRSARERATESARKSLDETVEQKLLDEKDFGDVVKVTCRLATQPEEWVFEKTRDDGKDTWNIRKPIEARATSWQVDGIHRRVLELRYEVSYTVNGGQSATTMSLADAGLEPPRAVITIADAAGKTATVELGKSASRNETYARMANADRIVVAKADFESILKGTILDYRDTRLFDFKPEEVVRLEATTRVGEYESSPVTYTLVRNGDEWVFEAPFAGRATDEIKNVLSALSTARMTKWKDHDASKLPLYGMDRPAVSLTVTVEKKKEIKKSAGGESSGDATSDQPANDNASETTETITETHVHTLHVSRLGPLGEDTVLYARVGDDPVVGTMLKTTTDKLVPTESKWRDMRVTTAAVNRASRAVVTLGGVTVDLIKQQDTWVVGDASRPADADAVKDLLKGISGLNAKTFVPLEGDGASMGLTAPEVMVSLTIPGQDQPERITVGAPSDAELKRMYYVRRNDSTQVAKVRTEDLKALLRPVSDYRGRDVFALAPNARMEKIELEYDNPVDDGRVLLTFEHQSETKTWRMTRPVKSDLHKERFDKLLESLRTLRAKRFVSDDALPSRFGFGGQPAVRLALTYVEGGAGVNDGRADSVASTRTAPGDENEQGDDDEDDADEGDDETDDDDSMNATEGGGSGSGPRFGAVRRAIAEGVTAGVAVSAPVPSWEPVRTVEFLVATVDGKHYLKRADASTIYEIDEDFFDKLREEYHEPKVLNFSESQVKAFSVRKGRTTRAFEKRDGQWVWSAERDLPLDQKAVTNLLVNLSDLKTERYLRYDADPSDYGLSEPEHEVSLTLDDGRELRLRVSGESWARDPMRRYPAVRNDERSIFLLGTDAIGRFEVRIETLEARQ